MLWIHVLTEGQVHLLDLSLIIKKKHRMLLFIKSSNSLLSTYLKTKIKQHNKKRVRWCWNTCFLVLVCSASLRKYQEVGPRESISWIKLKVLIEILWLKLLPMTKFWVSAFDIPAKKKNKKRDSNWVTWGIIHSRNKDVPGKYIPF